MINEPPISSVVEPDMRRLLDNYMTLSALKLNCHRIGTIVSFDSTKQTASVQIAALAVFGDKTVPYPVLTQCPVFVPSGGNGCLTMPVSPGDSCLVLFNDRDIDNWYESGAVTAPNTARTHDLSDGLVIVGFRHQANPIVDYSVDVEMRHGTAIVGLEDSGKISIRNQDTTLKNVLTTLITALNKLDEKSPSGSAAVQIADVNTLIYQLLK
jgi:hypothetical protein